MGKRYLTFFVLSNDASRSRQYKLPVKTFKVFTVLAAFVVVAILGVIADYARLRGNFSELHDLRKENTAQRIELQNFSTKIRDLETQIVKLNVFDKKLRMIANIEQPKHLASKDQVMGVGGGAPYEATDVLMSPGGKVEELVEQMKSDLDQLDSVASLQEESFSDLQSQLVRKASYLAATPSIWPVRGWVTSTFGQRISPFTGLPHMHKGMDIANRMGVPVVAPADGIVVKVRRERNLGKSITIRHGYGIKTVYGHLSKVKVRVGQRVKRGQEIGNVGNTGRSTGPHLHYAVNVNGVYVSPSKYILN